MNRDKYEPIARAAARKHGIDEDIFVKLVEAESAWNTRAVSRAGARGLGQLMPGTAAGLGVRDSFNPEENLDGAARYLSQQLKTFGGDYRLALAGYNAGPGNVRKYGGIPPFKETQAYVAKILGSRPPRVARGFADSSAPDEYAQLFSDIPEAGSSPQSFSHEAQAFEDLPGGGYADLFSDLPEAGKAGAPKPSQAPQGPPRPKELTPQEIKALVLKDLGGKAAEKEHAEALYLANQAAVDKALTQHTSVHTLDQLHNALKRGDRLIRDANGATSVSGWRKRIATALGVKPEQVTAATVARLYRASPAVRPSNKPPTLGGLQGWLLSLLPEGEVTYSGSLGAISRAAGDVPRLIQEGATRALTGGAIGEKELNEDIKGSAAHTVGEVGKGLGNLGSYLIPGAGQARLVSDVGGILGQAAQTGSAKPIEEAGQAIIDSFKVLDKDIPLSEKILRWVNLGGAALGGGYLLSKAGRANAVRATAAALKREARNVPELRGLSDKDILAVAQGAVERVARTLVSPLSTARKSAQSAKDLVQKLTQKPEANAGTVPVQARPGSDYERAFADLPDSQPKVVYHGTGEGDFQVPTVGSSKRGAVWVTEDRDLAANFGPDRKHARGEGKQRTLELELPEGLRMLDAETPEGQAVLRRWAEQHVEPDEFGHPTFRDAHALFDPARESSIFDFYSLQDFLSDAAGNMGPVVLDSPQLIRWLKSEGFDGLMTREGPARSRTYAIFRDDLLKPAQPRTPGAPRPEVERIEGAEALNPEGLIDQLSRDLRTSTPDTTRPFTRGALGEYDPNSTAKRLRWGNDLDTAAHELGHHLDNVQGLLGKADDVVKAELDELGKRTSLDGYTPEQVRQEGLAEAVRDLALSPGHLERVAPNVAKFLRENLTPEQLAAVQRYGQGVRQYAGASATSRMRAQIRFEDAEPGMSGWQKLADGVVGWKKAWDADGQYRMSGKAQLAALLVDESAPMKQAWRDAMKLVGHNPDELLPSQDVAGLVDDLRYVRGKIGDILEHGMTDAQGNRVGVPLKAIFERLWTGSEEALERDFRDAMALGVSERVIERGDKLVRDAQAEVRASREGIMRDLRALRADIRAQWEREVAIARVGHKPGTKRVEAKVRKLTRDRDAALERARREAKRELKRIQERKLREAQRQADSLVGTDAGVGAGKAQAQARKVVEELQSDAARFQRLKAALEAYRSHSQALLDYALAKGRIKRATYEAVLRDNDLYVAMKRVLGDDDGGPVFEPGPNLGRMSEFLHRFRGSKRTVENPVKSLVEQTAKVVREADRNAVMVKFTEALQGNAGGKELASIGRRVNKDFQGKKYKVVRDGELEYWAFQEDIASALDAIAAPGTQAKGLEWVLVGMARAIRFTATSSPRYLVRNFIRDSVDRVVRRKGGELPDYLRKASQQEVSDYHRLGGGLGQSELLDGARSYYDIQQRIMDELAGRQSKSVVVQRYSQLREASERANRIAEMRRAYKEAIERGMPESEAKLYAARSARELLDFAKGGRWLGNRTGLGRYVPFLNSSVQGMNALAKDFMRNPAQVGGRFVGKIVTTELAVYAWNQQQGAMEEWRQLPAYMRDYFWMVKVPGHGFLAIPKPFETGVLASAFSRSVDRYAGNEHALDGYGGSLSQSLLGPATNIAEGGGAQGLIGLATNRDMFRGQYIVPPHEERLRMDLRDGREDASRLAKAIGKVVPADERKIDYVIQGQLGDYGRTAAFLSDLGREDKNVTTPERVADVFTGLAKETPGTNAVDVQWVMEQSASVGVMGALKAEREAVRKAHTPEAREKAKARLVGRAKLLRRRIEQLTQGKSGEAYAAAVRMAMGTGG